MTHEFAYEMHGIPLWYCYACHGTYHHDGLYYAFIEHDDYLGQPDMTIQVIPGPTPPVPLVEH